MEEEIETKEQKEARQKIAFEFGVTIFLAGSLAPLAIIVGLFCIAISLVSAIND